MTGSLFLVLGLCLMCARPAGVFAQGEQIQIPPVFFPEGAAFLGVQVTLDSSLASPGPVAVDKAGTAFIAYNTGSSVVAVPSGGGAPTTLSLSLSGLINGIAVDGDDNLYITESNGSSAKVIKVSAHGGPQTTLGSGWGLPEGIAVDGAGDVFVADYGSNSVVELPAGGGQIVLNITANPSIVVGVAVDGAGDVFVSEIGGQVIELPAGGGAQTSTYFDGARSIAVDAAGDLFVSEAQPEEPGSVIEAPAGGGAQITLQTTGLNLPGGVAVDSAGDVFIADYGNNRVVEFETRAVNFVSANVCPVGQLTPSPCSQTLTLNVDLITGTGGQPALTPTVVTGGAANQEFLLSGTTCGTYSALEWDCAYTVTFAPMYSGMRTGAFQITAGAGGPALLTVPLYGAGIAPQIAFDSSVQTTIPATGVTSPVAVAVDGAGDVFIVDTANNRVVKEPAGGGAQITVDTELSNPLGVAVDGAGDLFVADHGHGSVTEIPTGNGATWKTVGTGLGGPAGVAVDAKGNVFIADYPNNSVVEVPFGGGPQITVASAADGLRGPRGIAVDQTGNLFVASSLNALVIEIPVLGSAAQVGTGWIAPYGVAVDTAGDVYVADYGQTSMPVQVSGEESNLTLGSGLRNPTGVAMDGAGNLFIADYDNSRVLKLPRSTAPSLNFGATDVGSTYQDGPQTVTLQNIGTGSSVLDSPGVSAPADFLLVSLSGPNPCVDYSFEVPSGEWCNVYIYFAPKSAGALSEKMTVTDNSLNATAATQSITLSGTGIGTPATMVSPTPGSALGTSNVTFTWTTGAGVTGYELWLGTSGPGSSSLYSSGATTALSATVVSVPAKGATVYARLFSIIGGKSQYNDYTYTETAAGVPATMTSPTAGSTLGTSNVQFNWTAGTGVTSYELWLGTSGPGSSSLYSSGVTTATSATVLSLQAKGLTVYARLFSVIGGKSQYNDYTYTETAAGALAAMISPTAGSTLGTSSVKFAWTAGTGVTSYELWLGTSGPGSSSLFSSGSTTALTTTVPTIPAKGLTVYARLFSTIGGKSQYNDYTYTEAAAGVPAAMASPAAGSTLGTTNVEFTWTLGTGVTAYELWLGTSGPGSSGLYSSGLTTGTTASVPAIPAKGLTVYARLFSVIAGKSQYNDYTYTEQ